MSCDSTCWLKKEGVTCAEFTDDKNPGIAGNYSAFESVTDPQPILQPHEGAAQLYSYVYPWQTRLIRLESGSGEEPLQCELLTADIISAKEFGNGLGVHKYRTTVEYTALSYRWGDTPRFSHPLRCGGVVIGITANLACALYYLRSLNEPQYLWIDAISINQSDPAEKSEHVRHMLKIYKKAKSMVIWLGPHSPLTRQAFCLLRESFDWERCQKEIESSIHSLDCLRQLQVAYYALQELLRNSWFRRTWIRQEVFGTWNQTVRCGHYSEGWRRFKDLNKHFRKSGGLQSLPDAEVPFESMERQSLRFIKIIAKPSPSSFPLFTQCGLFYYRLFLDGTRFEVTDPRDRVYAYVGIASNLTSREPNLKGCKCDRTLRFPIDYTKSISQVYQDVVKYLINRDKELGSLQVCESRLNRDPDLPSWVTDFRQQRPRALIRRPRSISDWDFEAMPQDSNKDNLLILNGIWVGDVRDVNEPEAESFKAGWADFSELYECFKHFGHKEDFDTFVTSGSYRETLVFPRAGLHMAKTNSDERRKYYERAFVAEGVRSGDRIIFVKGGQIPFVVRKIRDQNFSSEYMFLGPAIYGPLRLEWEKLPLEEFRLI